MLEIGSEKWARVVTYITANKTMTVDKIILMLSKKYKVTTAITNEITKLVKMLNIKKK